MTINKMTANERRAVISLSSIMSLRMIGLFMVLPVFTLYAHQLHGATPTLIGLAVGIYGLSQAVCQIPFGSLSDRFGRKPIILLGLLIFALGSLIAAMAHSIQLMIVGRALQGVGAVGSTILAMLADLTRESQRTKSMAIAGISIGFSFAIAMFIGPVLTQWLSINCLFLLAMVFGLFNIVLLYTIVPTPKHTYWHRDTEPELQSFFTLLKMPELAKLNSGIFILHAIFTASFVVIPIGILQYIGLPANQQWFIYLPTLFIAFIISLVCIGLSERQQQIKPYFIGSIAALILAEICLWLSASHALATIVGLGIFFAAFSILEAFLPSLISRTAPASRKGSALGIYSCAQFSGIFVGGVLGGWLYGHYSFSGVYLFCITLTCCWLVIAYFMQPPPYLISRIWPVPSNDEWHAIAAKLRTIPGIIEATFIAEDCKAYLKVQRDTTKHPDFICLQEQLYLE